MTQTRQQATSTEPQYCPRDPQTETNLRCGKCGDLICPNCLVQTDVGSRCPNCARKPEVPVFQPTWTEFALAAAAGLGTAGGIAVAYIFLVSVLPVPFLGVIAVGGAAWAAGEVIHRASGYKYSRSLQLLAGFSALVAYVIAAPYGGLAGPLVGLLIGSYYSVSRLR
ncbi:MAG: hypothetical protein ACOC5K_01005, partial [Chloroflexota bacterium]